MAARLDITEPPLSRTAAGRVPPHDLQAEESLLGAMMLSAGAIGDAAGTVTASDFYKPAHGHIFDAIHTLYASGQPVDAVTVADELRRAGLLDAIGGPAAPRADPRGDAGDHQRGSLRADRRGVLAPPPADRGGRRDRRARLLRARRRAEGARPRRVARLRGERAPGHRLDAASCRRSCRRTSTTSRRCTKRARPSPAPPPATSTSTCCSRDCSPARS